MWASFDTEASAWSGSIDNEWTPQKRSPLLPINLYRSWDIYHQTPSSAISQPYGVLKPTALQMSGGHFTTTPPRRTMPHFVNMFKSMPLFYFIFYFFAGSGSKKDQTHSLTPRTSECRCLQPAKLPSGLPNLTWLPVSWVSSRLTSTSNHSKPTLGIEKSARAEKGQE